MFKKLLIVFLIVGIVGGLTIKAASAQDDDCQVFLDWWNDWRCVGSNELVECPPGYSQVQIAGGEPNELEWRCAPQDSLLEIQDVVHLREMSSGVLTPGLNDISKYAPRSCMDLGLCEEEIETIPNDPWSYLGFYPVHIVSASGNPEPILVDNSTGLGSGALLCLTQDIPTLYVWNAFVWAHVETTPCTEAWVFADWNFDLVMHRIASSYDSIDWLEVKIVPDYQDDHGG